MYIQDLSNRVSVSLRSYIHSYSSISFISFISGIALRFRLLTELYSFLFNNLEFIEINNNSFRLLTELYSFLFKVEATGINEVIKFPSPYGVIFILIGIVVVSVGRILYDGFRLLTELYSFLSYGQKNLLLQYFFRVLSCDIFIFEIFLSISVKSILNSLFFEYRLTNIFL